MFTLVSARMFPLCLDANSTQLVDNQTGQNKKGEGHDPDHDAQEHGGQGHGSAEREQDVILQTLRTGTVPVDDLEQVVADQGQGGQTDADNSEDAAKGVTHQEHDEHDLHVSLWIIHFQHGRDDAHNRRDKHHCADPDSGHEFGGRLTPEVIGEHEVAYCADDDKDGSECREDAHHTDGSQVPRHARRYSRTTHAYFVALL